MLSVTKHRFVAKGMTSNPFSDETISSQKNRTFRDEVEVVTIGSFIYKFDETHTHSTKLIFFPSPTHQYTQCTSLQVASDALPFRRRFAFRCRSSLSSPSPSPSFATIQMQSQRFSSQTLPATLRLPQPRLHFTFLATLLLPSPPQPQLAITVTFLRDDSSFVMIQMQLRRFSSQRLPATLCLPQPRRCFAFSAMLHLPSPLQPQLAVVVFFFHDDSDSIATLQLPNASGDASPSLATATHRPSSDASPSVATVASARRRQFILHDESDTIATLHPS